MARLEKNFLGGLRWSYEIWADAHLLEDHVREDSLTQVIEF